MKLDPEPISTACFINPPYQSVCLYVYPLSLLGNGWVKILLQNRYCSIEYIVSNRRIVRCIIFCTVRVGLKESRRLVLSRTFFCVLRNELEVDRAELGRTIETICMGWPCPNPGTVPSHSLEETEENRDNNQNSRRQARDSNPGPPAS
jgi:hypothetical protein